MCTKKEWKQNNQTFSQTKSFVNSLNSNNEKKVVMLPAKQNKKKDKEIRMENRKRNQKIFY